MVESPTNFFVLDCASDKIWNLPKLLDFLVQHQGQDIIISLNGEANDLRLVGLYDILDCFKFSSVVIGTNNPFESHPKYQIMFNHEAADNRMAGMYRQKKLEHWLTVHPETQTWNQSKIFLGVYGRPTASRLGLAAHLHCHHREISHIHCAFSEDKENLSRLGLDKLSGYSSTYIELVAKMVKDFPLTITATDGYYDSPRSRFAQDSQLNQKYQDIFVDIVDETFVDGLTFFPTEKTYKSIWLKKPFIVYGSENFLLYLRQLGFKTFGQFWNEDYDSYQGAGRLARILNLIDHLAKIPKKDLADMLIQMQDILDHNYNTFMNVSYTSKNLKLIKNE